MIAGAIALAALVLVIVANQTSWLDRLPWLATQFQMERSGRGFVWGAIAAVVGLVTSFLGRKSRRRPTALVGLGLSLVAFGGFAVTGFSLPYYPFVRGLAWSPDGARVAYAQDNAGIWVVNSDGSAEPTQLTPSSSWPLAWSPDGTKIAYLDYAQGHDQIWVVSAGGSSKPAQSIADGSSPAWSPDGKQIAYVANIGSEQEPRAALWLMDADGGQARQVIQLLTAHSEEVRGPASWSPDGSQLVFVGVPLEEGPESIWMVAADGNLHRIAAGTAPAWSPDGTRIVYGTYPGQGPWNDYWVIKADGTGRTQLPGGNQSDPKWTADGRLAVDCTEGLCIMDADGGNRTVLLPGSEGKPLAAESARVLSPDGTRVAYVTGAGVRSDIVIHTFAGSSQITLIH